METNAIEKKSNAGRKPIADKKQTVTLYILQSIIDSAGGTEELKKILYRAIEKPNTATND